jgi:hypothetical protein
MPHFADEGMTEDEARDIAAYLKSLPPVSHAVPESTCPPLKGGDTSGDKTSDGKTSDGKTPDGKAADGGR